jgi:hypothetical protein
VIAPYPTTRTISTHDVSKGGLLRDGPRKTTSM